MALIDDLISAYLFTENAANTTVVDAHGSNTGTASTNTSNLATTGGKFGAGFDFTETNSEYINVGTSFDMTGGVTLSAWINIDASTTSHKEIFSDYDGSAEGILLYVTPSNNTIVFSYFISGVNKQAVYNFGSSLADAGDIMVTATFDGTDGKLYVNGDLKTTTNSPGTLTNDPDDLNIGRRANGTNYFDGIISQPLIWGVDKGATSITELYNSGAGLSFPFTTATLRLIRLAGTFVEKPIKTKVSGTFVDKPIKIKIGGTFQDA